MTQLRDPLLKNSKLIHGWQKELMSRDADLKSLNNCMSQDLLRLLLLQLELVLQEEMFFLSSSDKLLELVLLNINSTIKLILILILTQEILKTCLKISTRNTSIINLISK